MMLSLTDIYGVEDIDKFMLMCLRINNSLLLYEAVN